jgi:hypothetical protein
VADQFIKILMVQELVATAEVLQVREEVAAVLRPQSTLEVAEVVVAILLSPEHPAEVGEVEWL